jgi:hypothetical protein
MNKNNATKNSDAAHNPGFWPLLVSCIPALMAARIEALLMPPRLDMSKSFGIEPYISRRTSCKKDMVVRSSVYVTADTVGLNEMHGGSAGRQRQSAELFAGTPFKAAGWAGYEKHRQDQYWRRKKREKKGAPITHPAVGAAESRKQAGDDISENGCCHDLTATNRLSRVYWPSLPGQVPRSLPRCIRRGHSL